jgi:CBS domain-containing protein
VVSVGPETTTREAARLLREHGISAVPVVDQAGAPIGMLSEGDLIGRDESDREARRDWWLTLLAEGEALHPDFLASLQQPGRPVRDVMSAPVVAVGEDTDIDDIARLLVTHRIKRVPVLRDGRLVGIVSRGDLIRVLAISKPAPGRETESHGLIAEAVEALEKRFMHPRDPAAPMAADPPRHEDDASPVRAADFRALIAEHEHATMERQREQRLGAAAERRRRVAALIDQHASEAGWRGLLHRARQAAEQGQKEFLLLRFPSQLCGDGGRRINAAQQGWPATLRGEAAEIYLCWERDLKPQGFALSARVLDFPGGMPGEIGLFLVWER